MALSEQQFRFTLRRLGRRLRRQETHTLTLRTLWLPLAVALPILTAARVAPIDHYHLWAALPLLLWTQLMTGVALLRPLPPTVVANRTDRALGLQDRLTTALELAFGESERAALFDRRLLALQKTDALTVAATLDERRAFPLRWERRPLALAAGCLIAVLPLVALPNRMDQVLAERAAVREASQAASAALAALAQQVAEDPALAPDDRRELLDALEEAVAALRTNPGDREAALADIADLEALVRRELDPQYGARQAALAGLAADLAALAGHADPTPSLDEAARLLKELAAQVESLSPEQRQALASSLVATAQQTAGSDPALAAALSQMAQSVSSGEPPLAQSTKAATEAMGATEAEAALQQSLAQALNQSQTAGRSIAAAGRPVEAAAALADSGAQSGSQGQGEGSESGGGGEAEGGQGATNAGTAGAESREGESSSTAGTSSGSDQGGQGQGQGQNMLGSGGGTTADLGPEARLSGRAGAPVAPNRDYEVGALDTVFAPWERGPGGDPEFVGGRPSEGGQETIYEGQQPGAGGAGGARVPYHQVYASYATTAAEAMDREYIPAGLKAYVRDYFTFLEP
jgi:hypothetical protein